MQGTLALSMHSSGTHDYDTSYMQHTNRASALNRTPTDNMTTWNQTPVRQS